MIVVLHQPDTIDDEQQGNCNDSSDGDDGDDDDDIDDDDDNDDDDSDNDDDKNGDAVNEHTRDSRPQPTPRPRSQDLVLETQRLLKRTKPKSQIV